MWGGGQKFTLIKCSLIPAFPALNLVQSSLQNLLEGYSRLSKKRASKAHREDQMQVLERQAWCELDVKVKFKKLEESDLPTNLKLPFGSPVYIALRQIG